MAIYRNVSVGFWSDRKVRDEFDTSDKYLFLYLLTSPETSLCGVIEVSKTQFEVDTKLKWAEIEKHLERLEQLGNILYSKETCEVLILQWGKFNWGKSPKVRASVEKSAGFVKCEQFRNYIIEALDYFSGNGEMPVIEKAEKKEEKKLPASKNKKESITDIVELRQFPQMTEESVLTWLKYKTEKKKTYTETGLKALLDKVSKYLDNFGEDAVIEGINFSIANNYQGIVWDRIEQAAKRNGTAPGRLDFLGESW